MESVNIVILQEEFSQLTHIIVIWTCWEIVSNFLIGVNLCPMFILEIWQSIPNIYTIFINVIDRTLDEIKWWVYFYHLDRCWLTIWIPIFNLVSSCIVCCKEHMLSFGIYNNFPIKFNYFEWFSWIFLILTIPCGHIGVAHVLTIPTSIIIRPPDAIDVVSIHIGFCSNLVPLTLCNSTRSHCVQWLFPVVITPLNFFLIVALGPVCHTGGCFGIGVWYFSNPEVTRDTSFVKVFDSANIRCCAVTILWLTLMRNITTSISVNTEDDILSDASEHCRPSTCIL